MGWDSVSPFVTGSYADKGAFVLCKTSNPSSNVSHAEIYCIVLFSLTDTLSDDVFFSTGSANGQSSRWP